MYATTKLLFKRLQIIYPFICYDLFLNAMQHAITLQYVITYLCQFDYNV